MGNYDIPIITRYGRDYGGSCPNKPYGDIIIDKDYVSITGQEI